MTTEHDPGTRIVLSWLREDAHENAERVLLLALNEVDATPQRRSRWPAWRTDRMNAFAKFIAAAAAVMVVAIVGYPFLAGGSGRVTARPRRPSRRPPSALPRTASSRWRMTGTSSSPIGPVATPVRWWQVPRTTGVRCSRPTARGSPSIAIPNSGRSLWSPMPTAQTSSRSRWNARTCAVELRAGRPIAHRSRDRRRKARRHPPGRPGSGTHRPGHPVAGRLDGALAMGGSPLPPDEPQEILVVGQSDADGPRGIYVYDLATGGIRTIVEPAGYVHDVSWSPTREHISYDLKMDESNQARVVAADGLGDRALDNAPGTTGHHQVSPWSNDGNRIVIYRAGEIARRTPRRSSSAPVAMGSPSSWPAARRRTSSAQGPGSGRRTTRRSSGPNTGEPTTYQQADPNTGQVTELGWDGLDLGTSAWQSGTSAWQRLAP